MRWMILDLATAPMADAASFVTPAAEREPPSNYKTPEAIEKYQQAAFDKDVEMAGADLDLAQITGAAFWMLETGLKVGISGGDPAAERKVIEILAATIDKWKPVIYTYNGHSFDLPMLIRRAAYLGIKLPWLDLRRYQTEHVDVYEKLTNYGRLKARSLEWYGKRLGLPYTKPLDGAREAQVIHTGEWDLLKESMRHDVLVLARVARTFGFGTFPDEPGPAVLPNVPPVG